jgi:hypothetical protein
MTNLKYLGAAAVLICALGLSTFADCPAPGLMGGPPCIPDGQAANYDQTASSQSDAPTAAASSAEVVNPVSMTELALNVLTLF